MLILGDENAKNSRIPWVTASIILINVMAFLTQKWVGNRITYGFSLVPYEITHMKDLTKPQKIKAKVQMYHPDPRMRDYYSPVTREIWIDVPHYPGPFPILLTLLTSMFLHGDWVHLISNMWFLAIFGRNVESAWNHGRFLGFYLACGVAGGLCHILSDPNSVVPCLGASGAISGVMGAYVAVFPFNKVKLWFGWYIGVVEVPALVVIGLWVLWQYIAAFVELEMGSQLGGVAYWDHLGGFAAGLLLVWGTVWHLRRQVAREEALRAEQAEAAPGADATTGPAKADDVLAKAAETPDPIQGCMPPQASGPAPADAKPAAGRDPFGEYMAGRRGVFRDEAEKR